MAWIQDGRRYVCVPTSHLLTCVHVREERERERRRKKRRRWWGREEEEERERTGRGRGGDHSFCVP